MISSALDRWMERGLGDGSRGGREPLVLFAIFILPVLLAAVVSGAMTWRAMTETALSRRQAIASLAAVTLKERMDRLVDLGVSLATRVQFRKLAASGKWEDAVEIMRAIPRDFPAVERVLLADPAGVVRADMPPVPGVRGTSGAARDWYKGVSAAWRPYISEAYRRMVEPRLNVVAVTVPVLSEDRKPLGILVLQVKLETLLAWSREIGERSAGETLFVVDQHGHGASHPRFSVEDDIPDFSVLAPVREALQGGSGILSYVGAGREGMLTAAYAPVESYGWAVVVEQSSRATFGARNRAVGGLVLFFAGIAVLNVFLAGRLRRQAGLMRAILDSAGEGIVVADMGGRFTLWNPAATRLVGLGAAPLSKEAWSKHYGVYLPDKVTPFPPERLALARALKGEPTDDEEEFVRNPGHPDGVLLCVTARPLKDAGGRIIGGVATFRDMTFQKESEDAIRESEEKFRAVVGSAGDGIVSADAKGNIIYINRAAEALFGRAEGELLGRPLSLLMPERFRRGHEEGFARFLSGGEPRVVGRTVELAGLRKDGTEVPIELSLSSWKVGEERFFTAVIRDVTGRKRAENEIRELNLSLQDRALALTVSNKELESFSYSVSHDLRAPLRSIDGFSQVVLEEEGKKLSPEGRKSLERVRAATQRMGRLIDDMLAMSRVTRREMTRSEVDVSALCSDVVEDLRRAHPGHSPAVSIQPGMKSEGDPGLIHAVLANLIGNAWKFTSKKEGAQIDVGIEPGAEGGPAFFVRDNGAGFDMAYAAKLFGVFQRLHAESEYPGTGVGLATVQRIVARHGGRIWAEGAVGSGAVFRFTLSSSKGAS